MKKLLLITYLLVSTVVLTAQSDSLFVQNIADIAFNIGNAQNGGADWVQGVPNGIFHALGALIIGGIYTSIKRRRNKKHLQIK